MPAFAFRSLLSALILVAAAFAAVNAAEYQEFVPRMVSTQTPGPIPIVRVTPWWAIATAIAIVVVGVLLSAVVYPRRPAWSARVLRTRF
jgi:hypothetical protein